MTKNTHKFEYKVIEKNLKFEYLFIGPGCSQNFGHKGAKVFFQSSYYSYSSVYGMYRETYVLFEKESEREKKGGKGGSKKTPPAKLIS